MDWSIILSTVFTGLAVVFAVLLFLIALLTLISKLIKPPKVKKQALTPVHRQKPSVVIQKKRAQEAGAHSVGTTDSTEVVAVITAAVKAYSEASGISAKIVCIKKREEYKKPRSVWGNAGAYESMR